MVDDETQEWNQVLPIQAFDAVSKELSLRLSEKRNLDLNKRPAFARQSDLVGRREHHLGAAQVNNAD